jgi:hypothetical protein
MFALVMVQDVTQPDHVTTVGDTYPVAVADAVPFAVDPVFPVPRLETEYVVPARGPTVRSTPQEPADVAVQCTVTVAPELGPVTVPPMVEFTAAT